MITVCYRATQDQGTLACHGALLPTVTWGIIHVKAAFYITSLRAQEAVVDGSCS